jgi:hypothetical protein
MRITIEIDEKSGELATSSSVPPTVPAAAPLPASPVHVVAPPDVIAAAAAANGALNGGPAPTFTGSNESAPHAFVSQDAAASSSISGAVSAGSAAQAKPCG